MAPAQLSSETDADNAVLGALLLVYADRLQVIWGLHRDLTRVDRDILETMRAAGARLQPRRSTAP